MFEIIILFLLVALAFIVANWYSNKRSRERAEAFGKELDFADGHDSEAFQQRFDALFEREMQHQQLDLSVASEPEILIDSARIMIDERTETEPLPEEIKRPTDRDMVIALTIIASENNVFTGRAVMSALDKHDFHFGDMQLYHRYSSDSHIQKLFSVANILNPGTLLPDTLFSSTTPGLLLFARLPAPISAMALFDEMLDAANGISIQLNGVLCDDKRTAISQEGLERIRKQILNYQLSLQNENR